MFKTSKQQHKKFAGSQHVCFSLQRWRMWLFSLNTQHDYWKRFPTVAVVLEDEFVLGAQLMIILLFHARVCWCWHLDHYFTQHQASSRPGLPPSNILYYCLYSCAYWNILFWCSHAHKQCNPRNMDSEKLSPPHSSHVSPPLLPPTHTSLY